ncbi:bifunctional non-homologous end joining protein LigD [Fictibacillus enclensis]|uniref:DNA ligase D polymerase domain-containing protein n=1 Tax=Fictibacillus enclensis TaxID=1017270 RepID=A0A0V8JEM8_9BACL|nr:non-homologous end-joining DNA ligase [Fictibacillus enclensis]KSU85388.1 hypothetical protein AS030_07740 [Fictibacillus enclensis]SCB95911.1 bifunctional non-homologous end joining protein LigD [Fictibacillus enclensis]
MEVQVEGIVIPISHPEKMIWKEAGFTKADYIRYLLEVSDYMLPYTKDRMLMYWLYPHGMHQPKVEKRSRPEKAPEWLVSTFYKEKERILLHDKATLLWLANWGALEFHVPFDQYTKPDFPSDLVFDLDHSPEEFGDVLEISLVLKKVLDGLGLTSHVKTSGKTGLHLFVPIEPLFSFAEARRVNQFIAQYIQEKYPGKVTLERVKERRGNKLYFDYLQLWKGRTIAVPYGLRAIENALVSTPVTWEELSSGFHPSDFTPSVVLQRLREKGDLFATTHKIKEENTSRVYEILSFTKKA